MEALFETLVQDIKAVEAGYGNDPADLGEETKFGITKVTARSYGYTGSMKDLSWETAKSIYYRGWWQLLNLGEIGKLSPAVAGEVFDTGVNCRPGVAARFLQRSLNVLNREERDYPDLVVDGLLGGVTIFALKRFLDKRGKIGEAVLLKLLNSLQGARYVEISEARRMNEKFTFGWFKNRVKL